MKGLIAGTLIAAFAALAFAGGGSKPPVDETTMPGEPVFWAAHGAKEFWGDCFVIQYPRSFKLHPGRMGEMWHRPDEASFTSPDGTAEFYVLNPSISEDDRRPKCLPDPKTEVVVSTRILPGAYLHRGSERFTHAKYSTIRARDGSYTRCLVQYFEDTPCGGSAVAFGFRFRDARAFRQVPPRLRPLPPLHHPLGRLIPFQGRRFLRLNSGAQEAAWVERGTIALTIFQSRLNSSMPRQGLSAGRRCPCVPRPSRPCLRCCCCCRSRCLSSSGRFFAVWISALCSLCSLWQSCCCCCCCCCCCLNLRNLRIAVAVVV